MDLQKYSEITYEYPNGSYLAGIIKQRFQTLNNAIKYVHRAPPTEGREPDKYKLTNFDGKNIHLFQCCKQDCKSHILFKSHLKNKPDSKNKAEFQIYSITNQHNHRLDKQSSKIKGKPKHFPVMEKGSDSEEVEIDKLDYVKHRLRRYNISNYFRDYINCFTPKKQGDDKESLPFILPEIFRSKPFLVTLKIGYKCLNEKKKTYFFIIQVFSFGQLYTEIKFITCLKTKNPQVYLYGLTLIFTLLNSIRNCAIFMEEQIFRIIARAKRQAKLEKKNDVENFIKFFMALESDFLTDCTENVQIQKISQQGHIEKHHVQKEERNYERKKIFCSEDEYSHDSFASTDEEKNKFGLSPFMKKSYIKLQEMELREVRSIKNKCLMAETSYKEATLGKNDEWHLFQEKPSVLQKLNNMFLVQQINRLKKQRNKEKAICKDVNFICLSSEDSDEEKVRQKIQKREADRIYMEKDENTYLNSLLSGIFGDQFKEKEEKMDLIEKKQEKLKSFMSEMSEMSQEDEKEISQKSQRMMSQNSRVQNRVYDKKPEGQGKSIGIQNFSITFSGLGFGFGNNFSAREKAQRIGLRKSFSQVSSMKESNHSSSQQSESSSSDSSDSQ